MYKTEYKGYSIVGDGTFGNKLIKSIGKGALPKSLKGAFTNHQNAARAIDLYLGSKGDKDGKENTTS